MKDKTLRKWEVIERAVALLEQTITPNARVEHNVKLPEIATRRYRQCDVVIRYGKPPRQTLTIVEVQDRNSKVDLDKYRGWCKKRDLLGAQHLICVSSVEFPQSVREDAKLQGDSVRLITLSKPKELPARLPLKTVQHRFQTATTISIKVFFDKDYVADIQPDGLDWHAEVYECENRQGLRSMYRIADEFITKGAIPVSVNPIGLREQEREYRLLFGPPLPKVWFHKNGKRIPVLDAEIIERVEDSVCDLPVEVLAYVEEFKDGLLGWTLLAKGKRDGHEYYMQLPLILKSDGSVSVGKAEISPIAGLETKSFLTHVLYTVKNDSQKAV